MEEKKMEKIINNIQNMKACNHDCAHCGHCEMIEGEWLYCQIKNKMVSDNDSCEEYIEE